MQPYKHLSVICNLEDNMIRAYVRLGKEVEGHPVSLIRGDEVDVGLGLAPWLAASYF